MADGTVDTSFYPKPSNAAPPNAFAQLHDAVGAIQGINQNKLFQQNFQARQAIGPILQSAIDPQSGQLDYNKAFVGLAGNPATSWMAQDFLDKGIQTQKTQQDIAIGALDKASKEQGAFAGVGQAWLSDPNRNRQSALSSLGDAVAQGLITKDHALALATSMPQDAGQMDQWVKGKIQQNMTRQEYMDNVIGKINARNTGGQTTLTSEAPFGPNGQPTVKNVGTIANTPSPELQNTLVQHINPETNQTEQTRNAAVPGNPLVSAPGGGKFVPATGGTGATPSAPTPAPQSAPATAPEPTVSASPKGVAGDGGTSGTGAIPGAVGPGKTGVASPASITKLSPTNEAFQGDQGKEASDYTTQLNHKVSAGADLMLRLQEMRDVAGMIKTGGGAEVYQQAAKVAQALGAPQSVVDKIGNGRLDASEEFQKFATQTGTELLQQAMAGSTGKITNLEFGQFQKNNPNLETDPRAVERMFDFFTKVYQKDRAEQVALNGAMQKPGFDPKTWPATWQQMQVDRGIIKPEMTTGKVAPVSTTPGAAKPKLVQVSPGNWELR